MRKFYVVFCANFERCGCHIPSSIVIHETEGHPPLDTEEGLALCRKEILTTMQQANPNTDAAEIIILNWKELQ
jgi:hypothetical protein